MEPAERSLGVARSLHGARAEAPWAPSIFLSGCVGAMDGASALVM